MGCISKLILIITLMLSSVTLLLAITATASSYPKDFKRHASPHIDWEPGLKEAARQVLLRNKNLSNSIRDKLLTAPIIGKENRALPFGDIAVLARGQLLAIPDGFRFIQDPYQNDCIDCHANRFCKHKDCSVYQTHGSEKLLALWTVKRIRHRDGDLGHRYELEYTISPINTHVQNAYLNKYGGFNYNIPGHVFVVKTNNDFVNSYNQNEDHFVSNSKFQNWNNQKYIPAGLAPPPLDDYYLPTLSTEGNVFRPVKPTVYLPSDPIINHKYLPYHGNRVHTKRPNYQYLPQKPTQTYYGIPTPTGTTFTFGNKNDIYKKLLESLAQKTSSTKFISKPTKPFPHRFGPPTKMSTKPSTTPFHITSPTHNIPSTVIYKIPSTVAHTPSTAQQIPTPQVPTSFIPIHPPQIIQPTLSMTTFLTKPTTQPTIFTTFSKPTKITTMQTTPYYTIQHPIPMFTTNLAPFIPSKETTPYITKQTTLYTKQTTPSTTKQSIPYISTRQTTPYTTKETVPYITTKGTSVYITTKETIPFITTKGTTSYITTKETVPHIIEKETTPHITTKGTIPYITIKDTRPYITTNEAIPYVTTKGTTPYITTKGTVPYISTKGTIPYITTKEMVPYVTTKETTPYITTKETVPYVTTKETTPYITTKETIPYITTKQTTPYITTKETIPYTTTKLTTPYITTKETTPYMTSKDTIPYITTIETSPYITTKESPTILTTEYGSVLSTKSTLTPQPTDFAASKYPYTTHFSTNTVDTSKPIPTFFIDLTHPGYPRTTPITPFTESYKTESERTPSTISSTVYVNYSGPETSVQSTSNTVTAVTSDRTVGTTLKLPPSTDRYFPEPTAHVIHIPSKPPKPNTPFKKPVSHEIDEYDDYELFPEDKNKTTAPTTSAPLLSSGPPKPTEGFLLHEDEYFPIKMKDEEINKAIALFDKEFTSKPPETDSNYIITAPTSNKEIEEIFENVGTAKPSSEDTGEDLFRAKLTTEVYQIIPTAASSEITKDSAKIIYSGFFDPSTTVSMTTTTETTTEALETTAIVETKKKRKKHAPTEPTKRVEEISTRQSLSTSVSYKVNKYKRRRAPSTTTEVNLPKPMTDQLNNSTLFDTNHTKEIDYLDNKNKILKLKRKIYSRTRKVKKRIEN